MKNNRRDFLKRTGIASAELGLGSNFAQAWDKSMGQEKNDQEFSMNGPAVPKLQKVRVGLGGVGRRESGTLQRLSNIKAVKTQ